MSPITTFNTVYIGSSNLAVRNEGNHPDNASTLITFYDNNDELKGDADRKELVLGGVPLSVSASDYFNTKNNSDELDTYYYMLDVIEYVPQNKTKGISYETITFQGNRISAIRKDDRYYLTVLNKTQIDSVAASILPYKKVMLNGMIMAKTNQDELIVNLSSHPMTNAERYVDVMVGGIPLTAANIECRNYLVIYPTTLEWT